MSRIRLAREIARRTGSSLADATRFVRQVGTRRAEGALRAADRGISWRLPALGAVGTGGVLAWRQQNVREAEAIAEQSQNAAEAIRLIAESDDLDATHKQQLLDSIIAQMGDADSGDDDSIWPDLGLGTIQETILMMVVLMVVLAFAVNYASNLGAGAGGGR